MLSIKELLKASVCRFYENIYKCNSIAKIF